MKIAYCVNQRSWEFDSSNQSFSLLKESRNLEMIDSFKNEIMGKSEAV